MLCNRFIRFAGCCVLIIAAPWVEAQSISISPASPASSDAIHRDITAAVHGIGVVQSDGGT